MKETHIIITSTENRPIKGSITGLRHIEKTTNYYVWYFSQKSDADQAMIAFNNTFSKAEMLW